MPILMCPNCNAGMQEITRNGVLIDMCPQCRGVWLDRGEMEKLLSVVRQDFDERAAWQEPPPARGYRPDPDYRPEPDYRRDHDYRHHKRRKSRFEEIFDIFD